MNNSLLFTCRNVYLMIKLLFNFPNDQIQFNLLFPVTRENSRTISTLWFFVPVTIRENRVVESLSLNRPLLQFKMLIKLNGIRPNMLRIPSKHQCFHFIRNEEY